MTRTPVAVLGTLAEVHHAAMRYDVGALVRLVTGLRPDLLCLDLTAEQWRCRDVVALPPEYREALVPLAEQSDIVVIPVAGTQPPDEPAATGWRGWMIRRLRAWVEHLECTAPGPEAINAGPRHLLAVLLYEVIAELAGRETRRAWKAYTAELAGRVREAVQRDPGRRVLVAVNLRHCHHVCHALTKFPEVRLRPVFAALMPSRAQRAAVEAGEPAVWHQGAPPCTWHSATCCRIGLASP